MLTAEIPAILGVVAAFLCVLMFSGNALLRLLIVEKPYAYTPFYAIATGLGLWYIWALFSLNLATAQASSLWYSFIGFSVALWLISLRVRARVKTETHLGLHFIVCFLVSIPFLGIALADMPVQQLEFLGTLRNIGEISHTGLIPTWEESWLKKLEMGVASSGYSFLLLPLAVMSGGALNAGSVAVFQLCMVLLATGLMIRLWGVSIRWSNLPLTVAGAFMAIAFGVGLSGVEALWSIQNNILFSVLALAAFAPLMRGFTGHDARLIPSVIILSALVSFSPVGIWLWLLFLGIWMSQRLSSTSISLGFRTVISFFAMFALPILSLALWARYMPSLYASHVDGVMLNVDIPSSLENIRFFFAEAIAHAQGALLALILLVCFWFYETFIEREKHKNPNLIFVPTFMCIIIFIAGAVHANTLNIILLSCILVVPYGAWFMRWYEHSSVKNMAYKSPWGMGMLLLVIIVFGQMFMKPLVKDTFSAPERHTLAVTEAFRDDGLTVSDRLAVWHGASADINSYYTSILRYGLRGQETPIHNVDDWVYGSGVTLKYVHLKLVQDKVNYLWIHAADDLARKFFSTGLERDKSYLFAVDNKGFHIVKSYPHPQYQNFTD